MKTAVIGQGRIGREVLQLLPSETTTVLDSHSTITVETLRQFDLAIVLIPAVPFMQLLPTLLESRIPVVAGVTEVVMPSYLDMALAEARTRWVVASSFSLGMVVIHEAIRVLKHADKLFDSLNFSVQEVHDLSKHETPTTTARIWKEWLNKPCEIISERRADTVAIHELVLNTPDESITLRHEAFNRKIYARGAVWAAKLLFSDSSLPYGLLRFEDLTRSLIES